MSTPGRWHKDPQIHVAFVRLCDALVRWERNTGRDSILILAPKEKDERPIIAQGGKPVPFRKSTYTNLVDLAKARILAEGTD